MAELGQTLTNKVGPLPTWAWAGLGTAALAGYLVYRKKQSVNAQQAASAANADSSNLGTVPISNLVTAAEPMPTSNGPTFVSVTNNVPNTDPAANGPTPAAPLPVSGKGSASARASYDTALTDYRTASTSGANIGLLQKLMQKVVSTQSVYTGTAGTAASRTAYDNALAAYRKAQAAGNTKALPALQQKVNIAQAVYTGKV